MITTACFSPWQGGDKGTITINLGGSARSAMPWPPQDHGILELLDHIIILTGNGESITRTAKGGEIVRAYVVPGIWDVKVDAYLDGVHYATGTNSVNVIAGQNNFVAITMSQTLTGTVSITGTAQVGQMLTVNIYALGGTGTPNYQWKRNGNPIPGETTSTYTLRNDDRGTDITVTVTRDNYSGIAIGIVPAFGFNASTSTIVGFFSSDRNIVIPSSINGVTVTTIGDALGGVGTGVFENLGINSVVLPSGITRIGTRALEDNPITTVTLPEGLLSIGDTAFANTSLTSITIPASVTEIGTSAFLGCSSIEEIVFLPGISLLSIPYWAFSYTVATTLVIPNTVTSIGMGAFAGNNWISITIPANVVITDYGAPTEDRWRSFCRFYQNTNRLAGTYTFSTITDSWAGP